MKTCNCCKRELAELSDQKKQHDIDDVEVHSVFKSDSFILSSCCSCNVPRAYLCLQFFLPGIVPFLISSMIWDPFLDIFGPFFGQEAQCDGGKRFRRTVLFTSVGHALQGLCERQKLMRLWQKNQSVIHSCTDNERHLECKLAGSVLVRSHQIDLLTGFFN